MSATYEKLSTNRAKLTFEVSAETFETGMQAAYKKLVKQINLPGFRRGKAPRKMIESMYGESIFFEEAFDEIFPQVYDEAVKEHNITPVDQPEIELGEIGSGKPLTFTIEVYVRPDVMLGEYKGLKAPILKAEVTDEQIQQQLTQAQMRIARWVEVERPIQDGDRATIDYLGSIDGVPFAGGEAEGFALDIGSGTFITGFEEQLVGMSAGEEKDITVTFPEDYRAEDLAGKDAVFHVKVHDVKARELPELDDEFAMDVSEFDTLDEYKADIRAKLEKSAMEDAENVRDNTLVEAVEAGCEIDVPGAMVERQMDGMLRDMQMNMMMQGLRFEDFLQMTGQSMDMVREQYRDAALHRVRAELALEAIREAEGLEATEEDVQKQIEKYAEQTGRTVEEFKETLGPGETEYLEGAAVTEKVLQLLRDNAVYVEMEELEQAEDTAQPAEEAAQEAPAEEAPKKKKAPARKRTTKKKADAETEEPAEEAPEE